MLTGSQCQAGRKTSFNEWYTLLKFEIMAAITMISSAFALLLLISQVAFAQQWTPGGRRKHVGELLPTQSCYVTEVSIQ